MRYKVTYYRTLVCEDEIEANTFGEVKQEAECKMSDMRDTEFDQVHNEAVEIEHNGVQRSITIVTFSWT